MDKEQQTVFVLWRVDADSWSGGTHYHSVHSSIESALNDIPQNCLTTSMERECTGKEVANFTYFRITEEPLLT